MPTWHIYQLWLVTPSSNHLSYTVVYSELHTSTFRSYHCKLLKYHPPTYNIALPKYPFLNLTYISGNYLFIVYFLKNCTLFIALGKAEILGLHLKKSMLYVCSVSFDFVQKMMFPFNFMQIWYIPSLSWHVNHSHTILSYNYIPIWQWDGCIWLETPVVWQRDGWCIDVEAEHTKENTKWCYANQHTARYCQTGKHWFRGLPPTIKDIFVWFLLIIIIGINLYK